MVKKEVLFLISAVFLILFSLNFVISVHVTSSNLADVNVNQYYIYNITLNSTGTTTNGNITQVNITLPSAAGFLFVADSNRTYLNGTLATFVNTSTVLSWTNASESYLINGTIKGSVFSFNASASTPGRYNLTIFSVNATGLHNTTVPIRVQDTTVPTITLIAPTDGNSTINPAVNTPFIFNVTDTSSDGTTNCSLIFNGAKINLNSSVNISGGNNILVNSSGYLVSNTWNVNCTDSDNNQGNSSIYSFSLVSFAFNGTTKDENGNALNNSVINITVKDSTFTTLAYTSGTSNASGWFNFNVPSNSSWIYQPSITHINNSNTATYGSFVDFISKTIPALPSTQIATLAGTTFYLTPAGTINLTAVNASGNRILFQYQIKDTKLGYPVAEEHTSWLTEANIYVPKNRNYSIMMYPNQSMPVSYNWNNFSSADSYNTSLLGYNRTISTFWKTFNMTMTMARVSGYVVNALGEIMDSTLITWTNFTVIPYLLESGNMIHSQYGAMPYNLSSASGQTDKFNLASGFFNLSLPATVESSTVILFASLVNGTNYHGGFRNISLAYGVTLNITNITLYGLLGTAENITINRIDGDGQNIAILTAKQTFNLVNTTNSTLATTSAHVETTVDYSDYGALQFTWMTDVAQSSALANFAIPLLNITGIKEMNVFASGGPSGGNGQYAPKRVSTMTSAEITANPNITMKTFNPGAIDGSVSSSGITVSLYASNSSCDIPNPASSCLLTASSTMATFNPMQAVMGGGKISFRMGYGGILVHYVNVDMLASGPPDALFDGSSSTSGTTSTSFAAAQRFGSQGPTIYDYVTVSIPYSETAGSGLNDSAAVSISIPVLYDDNWNVIWNVTANGTSPSALAGNFSHYSTYSSAWGNLTSSKTCTNGTLTSSNQINETNPCYIDTTNNRIWIRLPHFSGAGPRVSGSTVSTTEAAAATSSGGSGTTSIFWTNSQGLTNTQFANGYTKEYSQKHRATFTIGTVSHSMGVISLTSTTATINVSSVPQQKTLSVGDEWKVEVTGDNSYDVLVKLNSIANNKANITTKSINEVIAAAPITPPAATPPAATPTTPTPATPPTKPLYNLLASWPFWTVVTVIIIVIVVLIFLLKNKKRYYRKGY